MPDNPVSEQTRRYWLDTVFSWAQDRLMPPQLDECRRALLQADPTEADSYMRARRDDLQKANLKLLATLQQLAAATARAERLAAMLRTLQQWEGHASGCLSVIVAHANDDAIDMEACDCGWRELAAEIDAALAGQADGGGQGE